VGRLGYGSNRRAGKPAATPKKKPKRAGPLRLPLPPEEALGDLLSVPPPPKKKPPAKPAG